MPALSRLEGARVLDTKGKSAGRVGHVLFHPSEPRVVGYQIEPPRLAYVVERKPFFVALDGLEYREGALHYVETRPSRGAKAEKSLGFSWDDTVIWVGMPVRRKSGEDVGFVGDAAVSAADGSISSLGITDGLTADVMAGELVIPAADVIGFDGEFVRVAAAAKTESDGGIAASAGRGAAKTKIATEQAARKATAATIAAARVAVKSDMGKRAAKGWRAFADAVKDGWEEDEED